MEYGGRQRDVNSIYMYMTTVMRQPCNSLNTNFSRVQRGHYTIKVIHLSENGREVITATVYVPPLTS